MSVLSVALEGRAASIAGEASRRRRRFHAYALLGGGRRDTKAPTKTGGLPPPLWRGASHIAIFERPAPERGRSVRRRQACAACAGLVAGTGRGSDATCDPAPNHLRWSDPPLLGEGKVKCDGRALVGEGCAVHDCCDERSTPNPCPCGGGVVFSERAIEPWPAIKRKTRLTPRRAPALYSARSRRGRWRGFRPRGQSVPRCARSQPRRSPFRPGCVPPAPGG